MKKITILFLLMSTSLFGQEISPSNVPNATQKAMIKRGYGMFIHFGVNTFADVEWSNGSIPASRYNPTELDCDQWVRVARDAGFRYVLLTTKHCDGFCLWDSKYTEYDVASSSVKTDVVAEVTKACKKYGLEFAVYYSLWDRKEPTHKLTDARKYVDYMENQLGELLTNYGDVCELWLDGGWEKPVEDWQISRIYSFVKKLQPKCAISVNHSILLEEGNRKAKALPDSMIVDDKYTFQYFPMDFRLWDPKVAHKLDKKQYLHDGESYYMPFEHTICLSKAWTWFQKKEDMPIRDLDELEEIFYWCTDNNNMLVMNVPPAHNGKIREYEANAVIELAKRIGIERGKPLPRNGKFISLGMPVEATSVKNDDKELRAAYAVDGGMQTCWEAADSVAMLTVELNPEEPFNKISIFECCDVKKGKDGFTNYRTNRIKKYKIEILQDEKWITIYFSDVSMGDCKVINFPKSYKTSKIRLNVLKSTAPPSIYEFNVINNHVY